MIRKIFIKCLILSIIAANSFAADNKIGNRYLFPNIINISYTPDSTSKCQGWFSDQGAWIGFTIPEKEKWINGFCGPYTLDFNKRQWIANSILTAKFKNKVSEQFTHDSTTYYPGELYLSAHSKTGSITQVISFINSTTALVKINCSPNKKLSFLAEDVNPKVVVDVFKHHVIAKDNDNDKILICFNDNYVLQKQGNNYIANSTKNEDEVYVTISYVSTNNDLKKIKNECIEILKNPKYQSTVSTARWNEYLTKTLRPELNPKYDRIAIKSLVTLISNWRSKSKDLLHDGIVPSHAVGYFVGFWAWDSWRHSAAIVTVLPNLAKDNIRAMFDYQQQDGMIIDCIYSNSKENNSRNSKPPIASWAVDRIFSQTKDTSFLKEMFPKLLRYYNWWYLKRDINKNGVCEYGATDGTLEAAAWESGMDNAIRFDNSRIIKNLDHLNAFSINQESVDLNSYLVLESRYLNKFASILGYSIKLEDKSDIVSKYFFDIKDGFYYDRNLDDGSFIKEQGCEAFTPLWCKVATSKQVELILPILVDKNKFSTHIPFPTIAADNIKYNPRGYWRGPIWLDQVYFAIHGLRNYNYNSLANNYTKQVFENLDGLIGDSPINENYDTHTGKRLKAPHFSWSAAHLLLLYEELQINNLNKYDYNQSDSSDTN